jgi:hypothetical protein
MKGQKPAKSMKAEHPPLIPLEVLFGNPVIAQPRLSPKGERLAYLAPKDGVMNVWARTLGGKDDKPVTNDRDRGIFIYFWAHDNRNILYLQDAGGNENWRLYAVDVETAKTRELTPFENVNVQIIGLDRHYPDEMLIGMNKENVTRHDVYHLRLSTGELKLVAKNPGGIGGWVADSDLKVRAAVKVTPDARSHMLVRSDEKSDWRTLVSWECEDGSRGTAGSSTSRILATTTRGGL